ncbi:membrane-bound lytic murein transglycosylase MltF [Solemya velesiana gill symbiont]|uniref:Membrane-bound lytic murein transglycosylase F n=1 Tax=Solemya velesiana gill symbiont TaxID=1918948 RepID=A0A1T2KMW8_9GAMM|nr:membrane-bound lytic murein transglycosylase MltF [Solemya velesiana gill symbiont]OOZ34142.1 lytic transglycosylase F [Solemya velesiana gill symbiont]
MRWFLYLTIIFLLAGCSIPEPLLEEIKDEGTLIVITRNSPTTYYEGPQGFKGFEYELVESFTKELGVEVKYVIPDSFSDILPMIARGEAHLAAAGLTVTPKRETMVRFSVPYQQITQQVIYRSGKKRPKKITDTIGGTLEIVAGSSHEEELERLKEKHPELKWAPQKELESEELIYLVKEQVIDYTIADSNEAALNLQLYPELKVAFDLTKPQPLAWAFQHAEDSSLFDAAKQFLEKQKADGTLDQLIERYYGHVKRLGFVDKTTFTRHIAKRLPEYVPLFKKAAEKTGLDWQLLAAIGYQESHWNPKAVSPTGVRGIMMLTKATAKQLDIEDREDPEQSIMGGARYVRLVEKKIPKRIQNPDRLWFALAGYNVGFGHLEDARILAQRDGADPDKWADVKQYLPLLSQEKHFKTLKHGYARGREPVNYVDNIRNYYELLVWHNENQAPKPEKPKSPLRITTPAML